MSSIISNLARRRAVKGCFVKTEIWDLGLKSRPKDNFGPAVDRAHNPIIISTLVLYEMSNDLQFYFDTPA